MRTIAALIVLALAVSGPVGAQESSSQQVPSQQPTLDDPPATLDEVVVVGDRLEEIARQYVDSLAAPARRRGLARWDGEVCIGVVNFRAEAAYPIIDRISEVARELEIDLGEPGCDPNLFIIGTTEGPQLATDLVRRHRRNFFRYGFTSSNRGSGSLARFQTSDEPVRWWHVSLPIVAQTGQAAIRLPGQDAATSTCRTRSGSWAANCDAVYDRLVGLIVIVDVDGLGDVSLPQLADYLTLVALAQVEPDADHTAVDTVLNLFRPDAAAGGLTAWDRTYLRALYSGDVEHLSRQEQASRIVATVEQDRVSD